MNADATIRYTWQDEDPEECPLAAFLAANEEDEDTCAEVRALAVGQSVRLGGGAAPIMDVERVR